MQVERIQEFRERSARDRHLVVVSIQMVLEPIHWLGCLKNKWRGAEEGCRLNL
jgi:hypothetical protein